MSRAREYLQKAEEAEAMAANCRYAEQREGFLKLAEDWRDLARRQSAPFRGKVSPDPSEGAEGS